MTAPLVALLAAGASSRMGGRDKLLETVGGVPLLRVLADRIAAAGLAGIATLPPDAPPRRAALRGSAIRCIGVDASEGMAASLRAAVAAAQAFPALMVLPADMPEIAADDLRALADAWMAGPPDAAMRAATCDGRPGQPVVLPRRLYPAIAALRGDTGARGLLRNERVGLLPLADARAVLDLDTPEDWAAWRRRSGIAS
ncbi:molybdopterin-guanine dinucleotide biosynthesis protein A-like protein [Oceaniovalibus guishaninsula JLT2003]|uniref:Molybdopterin-guanine dinucleotide biosynthesis protein A-like protein n=1 Tax=Oceaniovalibus guishaninsula JLT2003 TaxID=1231392 RepID=K2I863_9RHOB|nr:NTP transferase domain-containing protein [Oceaniovalibus guishaninsula]EKE45215.1 molybdopterin-guanine dinucleotide biosynthesis protein A-like protein [Oceaniovalibus guishaninsula JLT2003]